MKATILQLCSLLRCSLKDLIALLLQLCIGQRLLLGDRPEGGWSIFDFSAAMVIVGEGSCQSITVSHSHSIFLSSNESKLEVSTCLSPRVSKTIVIALISS